MGGPARRQKSVWNFLEQTLKILEVENVQYLAKYLELRVALTLHIELRDLPRATQPKVVVLSCPLESF